MPAFIPVTLDDVETMLPLMQAYYEFDRLDFNEDHARRALRRLVEDESLGRVWLIRQEGEVAGYVALTYDYGLDNGGREGFIDELYLKPGFRGKGIGRETIRFLEGFCAANGICALLLGVRHDNTAAQTFYATVGFEDTGLRMWSKAIPALESITEHAEMSQRDTNSVIKVTLDTNCIIKALKPDEDGHTFIRRLIDMYNSNLIQLQVVAANAFENGRSLDQLKEELEKLNLRGVEILSVPLILGMSYIGGSYLVDKTTEQLLKEIWSILFPSKPFDHAEFRAHSKNNAMNMEDEPIDKNWRNHMCDALMVLEYIRDCTRNNVAESVNIFVTADGDDILKKRRELATLGAQHILTPQEAITKIEQMLENRPT